MAKIVNFYVVLLTCVVKLFSVVKFFNVMLILVNVINVINDSVAFYLKLKKKTWVVIM